MRYIPILYSTEMVKAVQDDRKTMTRRTKGLKKINECPDDWYFTNMTCTDGDSKEFFFKHKYYEGDDMDLLIPCPYGKVGDILWVKEDFYGFGHWIKNDLTNTKEKERKFIYDKTHTYILYKDEPPGSVKQSRHSLKGWYKRTAFHMERDMSRLFLIIKDIRIERLQNITEDDAIKEGVEIGESVKCPLSGKILNTYKNYISNRFIWSSPVISFLSLWQSINGKESWEKNPWVFVIEFERTNKPDFLNS